jgi:ferredoxin-NADP reductase
MKHYPSPDPGRHFMLCGWTNMIDDAVVHLIIKAGYKKEQVSYELYG